MALTPNPSPMAESTRLVGEGRKKGKGNTAPCATPQVGRPRSTGRRRGGVAARNRREYGSACNWSMAARIDERGSVA